MPQELRDYDAVVFDPPRQGAQAQVQQLAASKIPVVVAVSCNVATFARDARILIDGGYRLEGVTPVDQFRHTPHVELVARFRAEALNLLAGRMTYRSEGLTEAIRRIRATALPSSARRGQATSSKMSDIQGRPSWTSIPTN